MRIKTIFLYMFFLSGKLVSQNVFEKIYGESNFGTVGNCVVQSADLNFVIAGSTFANFAATDLSSLLMKTDTYGNILWSKSQNVLGFSLTSYSTEQVSDSGFILVGEVDTVGKSRACLIKTDSGGNMLWAKVFECVIDSYYVVPNTVRQTLDGGFIISGNVTSLLSNKTFLIKTDANGNLLWTKLFYRPQLNSYNADLVLSSDGGFVIVGSNHTTNSLTKDLYLLKVDSSGIPIWNKTIGTFPADSLVINGDLSHIETVSNGYLVSGSILDARLTGLGFSHVYLLKTDLNGNFLWAKIYQTIGEDEFSGYSVKKTSDSGGFILSGEVEDSLDDDDIYLMKTDSVGNLLWNRTSGFLSDGTNIAVMALPIFPSGYSVLAKTWDWQVYGLYFIKTDSLGNTHCNLDNPVATVSKTFWDSTSTLQVDSSIFIDTVFIFTTSNVLLDTLSVCPNVGNGISNLQIQKNEMQISPNPFSESTTIKLSKALTNATVEIYDEMGQQIVELKNIFGEEINLNRNNLKSGIYFIRLMQQNQIISSGNMIITDRK